MFAYFKRNALDADFYQTHIEKRLPDKIIDAHMHINLPEHVASVSEMTIKGDWALECGMVMTYEDANYYHQTLFPGKKVHILGLPWPLPEADIKANNQYLADLKQKGMLQALMTIRPEWPASYVEEILLAGNYAGFKPYPYMAAAKKGADISIFDFLPHEHLAVADRHRKAVLLHLPRKGRLADPDNIIELRQIVQKYPNIKLVLAHFGRCFNPVYFETGIKELGDELKALYFDTAAVINPAVHQLALENLQYQKILFGTDFPILLWHGKREWTETEYINLCREDFSWNLHQYPDKEDKYTFFVYEQIKAILDSINQRPEKDKLRQAIFFDNAASVYGMSR